MEPCLAARRGRELLWWAVCCFLRLQGPALAAESEKVYVEDVRFAVEQIEQQCGGLIEQKKIDWKQVADSFLKEARTVKTDPEHLVLLTRLLARLRDGHARVVPLEKGEEVKWPDDGRDRFTGPGMFWCRIKGKYYVKNSFGSAAASGVVAGSEILKVDGTPAVKWVEQRAAEVRDLESFSTEQQELFFVLGRGLAAAPGTRMELEVKEPDGKPKKRTVTYTKDSTRSRGPAVFPENLEVCGSLGHGRLASGFGYIHLSRCPEDLPLQMDASLQALQNVPGLILDFRGNGGGGFDHDALMGRFIPEGKKLSFAKSYESAGEHPYAGPVVVIVDATVISAAETASGMFKEDGRGYMIGESATAGMSSQKTTIELPSRLFGLYVSTGSNKGRFNGGRGIEGIGVAPHELLEYNPGDLSRGVDTLIARAQRLLADFPADKVPYHR